MWEILSEDIFFNIYSFGTLLGTVFFFFLGIFLLVVVKDRSRSTVYLGLGFLIMGVFYIGYLWASLHYSPVAAYHRWVTVGLILPAIVFFTQWFLRFPENDHPRFTRGLFIVQLLISMATTVYFVFVSLESEMTFHFTGHYWDFDAEDASRTIAVLILLFIIGVPIVGIWRTITVKSRERWAILQGALALLFAALVPAITNALSRDGVVSRALYLNLFVLMTVGGFSYMIVMYINTTKDRTTFMAKIVGITLVTFFLIMQGLSFFTMQNLEVQYDQLRVQNLSRAAEGGQIHSDIKYLTRFDTNPGEVDYLYTEGNEPDFYLPMVENLYLNTAVYEDIAALPGPGFRHNVEGILEETHEGFQGYQGAILGFVSRSELAGEALKEATLEFIEELDQEKFVHSNKIRQISDDNFRTRVIEYLSYDPATEPDDFRPFQEYILPIVAASPDSGKDLKNEVLTYLAPLTPQHTRHYRATIDGFGHYITYLYFDRENSQIYEAGFSYREYRQFMHASSRNQKVILVIGLFIILVCYPFFFRGSLTKPLGELLQGVEEVNQGNLDVHIPIRVRDEIGILSTSYNSMVTSIREAREKLQDYAANLEEKVMERTQELNNTLEQVQALKKQQDGDYFLTSLLANPLFYNANKSKKVTTEFLVEQKKKFEFRGKKAELGGDICLTGNLRLGTSENFRRYIVALNADAMGKSMQGAGGVLVMGVVMNSILARSARHDRILDMTPEQWLTEAYEELQGVFMTFNGSMAMSVVINVVDEMSGEMWYFNAEHPYQVLYRNGKASFIEEELLLRKIGLESEIPFKVYKFQLEPNDVLIVGTDGRDDIDMTPNEEMRTINHDEYLFLEHVEKADGDLHGIMERVLALGELTDDIGLLRIGFQEVIAEGRGRFPALSDRKIIDIDVDDIEEFEDSLAGGFGKREGLNPDTMMETADAVSFEGLYEKGKLLAREKRHSEALEVLRKAYSMRQDYPALNRILAVMTFKEKDYEQAVKILDEYLQHDPEVVDFWLYLSIAHKRTGDYEKALETAERVYELNPNRVPNLIQLADLYHKKGENEKAASFLNQAIEMEPENQQAKALQSTIARV